MLKWIEVKPNIYHTAAIVQHTDLFIFTIITKIISFKKGSWSFSIKSILEHSINMNPRKLYVKLEKKLLVSFKKNLHLLTFRWFSHKINHQKSNNDFITPKKKKFCAIHSRYLHAKLQTYWPSGFWDPAVDGPTDRQTDRPTDRQTDRPTPRHGYRSNWPSGQWT